MTSPLPNGDGLTAVAANGCTECNTQNTVVLDSRLGRRCMDHAADLPHYLNEESTSHDCCA